MNTEELYNYLDIEEPEDFQYFENLALLFECEDEIKYDDLYFLLKNADRKTLAVLIDDYFEELSDFFPEDDTDFYLLMDKIRLSLKGLALGGDEENVISNLTEEIDRFRQWYSVSSEVICSAVDMGEERTETVRDAIALARLEKLGGEKFLYDFRNCEDYPLDEYIMSFADVAASEESASEE